MAKVNQIYAIVNDMGKQVFGEKAVTVVDTSSLIALGDLVLSTDKNRDMFNKELVDRIGMTIIDSRVYERDFPDVVRHDFDYGVILQKIYIDIPESGENPSWKIGEENFKAEWMPVIKPSVKQKLFSKVSTWEVPITVPDVMYKTAFTSAQMMAVLIKGIFVAVENGMRIYLEACVDLTRASFIARKMSKKEPCQCINLLADYNTLFSKTLTVDKCLYDKDFLQYAAKTISVWSDRLARMSSLFNEEDYRRHTPKELQMFTLLSEVAKSFEVYLDSSTFHNELVSLPRYTTTPFWQGSGTDYSFASTSAINLKLDAETTVNVTGVIGVIFDYEALGTTMSEIYETSERNSRSRYTNYYKQATFSFFNDMSENGIVFYIANSTTPPNPNNGIEIIN